jgi:hypothetical protein
LTTRENLYVNRIVPYTGRVTVSENSRVRSTIPFLTPHFLADLKKIVCCCYEWEDENFDRLNAKGCPPEHYAMKERAEMRQEMRSEFKAINARMDKQDQQFNTIQNSVQKLPEQMQKGLEDFVESNAIRNGTVTHAQFESFTNLITSSFESVQAELVEFRNQSSVSAVEAQMVSGEDVLNADDDIEVFETAEVKPVKPWGGKLRRLRQGFQFPNAGLKEALAVWYYGGYYPESCLTVNELRNGERVRYPPLRLITCHDLERHNHSRKSKWSKVIRTVISFSSNIPKKPNGKELVDIMNKGKHAVMSSSLLYDIDQSSNTIDTMYNYLRGRKRKRDQDLCDGEDTSADRSV